MIINKKMEKIKLSAFIVASIFLLGYLIGSFTQASFLLNEWSEGCRVFIGAIIGICVISSVPFIFVIEDNK